jgi:hypothetical protein
MPKKIVPIDYTSADFDKIKRDLVNYAKKYYPNTYKDFNEASFGSLMTDLVSYVGESVGRSGRYICSSTNRFSKSITRYKLLA